MASLTLPVDSQRDHIEGPEAAPITLVEYGDYECPYCGAAYPTVKSLQAEFGDRLRFVFRNFPLTDMHPHAEHAAEAAEAASAQGKFWEMHDALYEHQRGLGDTKIKDLADSIGLHGTTILEQVHRQVFAGRIEEDFESGVESGVNGTPTFFINGQRFDGAWDNQSEFREALRAAK